jgi:hypothetical protein
MDVFKTDEEFLAEYPILVKNNSYSGNELKQCNSLRRTEDRERFEECAFLKEKFPNEPRECVKKEVEFYGVCAIYATKLSFKDDTYYLIQHSADYCGSSGCGFTLFSHKLNMVIFYDHIAGDILMNDKKIVLNIRANKRGPDNWVTKRFSLKKLKEVAIKKLNTPFKKY